MNILNILFWFLVITIYCNIGYWGSKSYFRAVEIKKHGGKPNIFQKFQNQINWYVIMDPVDVSDEHIAISLSVLLWPIILGSTVLLLLFKFVFLGGFFRLIAGLFKKIF